MKALKSYPQIERPRRINSRITLAKYTAGLVLALVGLIGAATLVTGPISPASAQVVAWSWLRTGSLNTPRRNHTAALLSDGKVLVAGGSSGSYGGVLDTAELYDPVTGEWKATDSLNERHTLHTATLLKDGKVLIVGGSADDDHSFNGAELYDPKDERWSVTGSLDTSRCFHTATLLKNGKVLVVGGLEEANWWDFGYTPLDTVELYDSDTGMWSFTGNLNFAVESHTATLLQNGKVLIVGGSGENFSFTGAELYDPDTEKWSSVGIGGGNIERYAHTATLLHDGRVLIVGGVRNSIRPEPARLYDPDTGAWSSTGDLNETRFNHTATLLPDGKVLVAGGMRYVERESSTDSGIRSVSSLELYDPDKGTWSFVGSLETPRFYHTATLLSGGIPLIVGGAVGFTGSLDSVELGNTFAAVTPPLTLPRKPPRPKR